MYFTGWNSNSTSDSASHSSRLSAKYIQGVLQELCTKTTRATTAKVYHRVWTNFNKFLIKLDSRPNLWENRAALFCAHLVESGRQSATVKSYVSVIKKILTNDGYHWDDKIILMQSITKACHIKNDKVRTRLPIRIGMLELMLFELQRVIAGNQPYLVLLYRTVFILAYYGLMHIWEPTCGDEASHYVRAKDVHVAENKNKILVILYTSKTHGKESRPQRIKISSQTDEVLKDRHFCPFAIVRNYMACRGGYTDSDEPFLVFREKLPVLAKHVHSIMNKCIVGLGLDSSLYDSHSFRIGKSSNMIKAGHSIESVKFGGRWKSSTVYKYIRNQ